MEKLATFFQTSPVNVDTAGHALWLIIALPLLGAFVCGVFGNIVDADIEATIRFLPSLCAPGAWVLWTRHPRVPGVIPSVERWFAESGFEPVSTVIGEGDLFGAGAQRFAGAPSPCAAGVRLFDFVR